MVNPAHISTCPWRDDLRCSKATHRVCVQFPCLMVTCCEHQKFFPHFFTFAISIYACEPEVVSEEMWGWKSWTTWFFRRVLTDLENSKFSLWTCWRDRIRELPSTGHGSRFSKNRDRQTDTHTHTHTHVLVHVHTHIHIHMPYISICICIYTHYIIYISILSYPIYPIYPIYQPINLSIYQCINQSNLI